MTAPMVRIENIVEGTVLAGPCGHVMYNTRDGALWLRTGDGQVVSLVPASTARAGSGHPLEFDLVGELLFYRVDTADGRRDHLYELAKGTHKRWTESTAASSGFATDTTNMHSIAFRWEHSDSRDGPQTTFFYRIGLDNPPSPNGRYLTHARAAMRVIGRQLDGRIVSVDLLNDALVVWDAVAQEHDTVWLSDDGNLLVVQSPWETPVAGGTGGKGGTLSGVYNARTGARLTNAESALRALPELSKVRVEQRAGTVAFFFGQTGSKDGPAETASRSQVIAVDTESGRSATLDEIALGSGMPLGLLTDGRIAVERTTGSDSELLLASLSPAGQTVMGKTPLPDHFYAASQNGTLALAGGAAPRSRCHVVRLDGTQVSFSGESAECMLFGDQYAAIVTNKDNLQSYRAEGRTEPGLTLGLARHTDLYPVGNTLIYSSQERSGNELRVHSFVDRVVEPPLGLLRTGEQLRAVRPPRGKPLLFTGVASPTTTQGEVSLIHGAVRVP